MEERKPHFDTLAEKLKEYLYLLQDGMQDLTYLYRCADEERHVRQENIEELTKELDNVQTELAELKGLCKDVIRKTDLVEHHPDLYELLVTYLYKEKDNVQEDNL